MKRLRFVGAVLMSVTMAIPVVAAAQAKPIEKIVPTEQATTSPVTLKVTVVLSRYAGEKKIANLPFVLMVVAGDSSPTTVQMSSQVPIPQTSFNQDGKSATMSYSYQNVGTSISASAKAVEAGLFNVSLTISDSQIMSMGDNAAGVPGPAEALKGLVRTQNFSSVPRLLLRDGQTIQYAAATDKTTGEVVKVDVTLNVIK